MELALDGGHSPTVKRLVFQTLSVAPVAASTSHCRRLTGGGDEQADVDVHLGDVVARPALVDGCVVGRRLLDEQLVREHLHAAVRRHRRAVLRPAQRRRAGEAAHEADGERERVGDVLGR